MQLFMIELEVSHLPTSLEWYRDRIGLGVEIYDAANGFALLNSPGGRLALKRGTPSPAGVLLHFRVADLAVELSQLLAEGVRLLSPIKASDEGYRRAIVADPDRYRICLFEAVSPIPRPA